LFPVRLGWRIISRAPADTATGVEGGASPMRGVVVFFASAIFVIALELIGSPQVSAGGPVKVCGPADPDAARCHAQLQPGRLGDLAQSAPYGLSPAQIKSAYGFSTSPTAGAGKTIAIVDAFNDPTAESDLAVFS